MVQYDPKRGGAPENGRPLFFVFVAQAILVTAAFFGPYLGNFFAFDDFAILEHIQQGPKAVLLGYNYILRFVANASAWPVYAVSGFDPLGYNLFAAILWCINAILFYRFLNRLLGDRWHAFVAATIFVASTVGIDAAFWKAANSTLLNLTFYLLTLHAYVVFRQTGNRRQWWLSLLWFAMAVFSKEEAASLPFVVLLLELFWFDGMREKKAVALRLAALCSVVVFYVLLNYVVTYQIFGAQAEVARYSAFRPLRSLFTGWTAFSLTPDSRWGTNDPRLYLTCLLVPLSFLLVKDRRLLILGYAWVFFTFLPQSLSTLTQLEPRYLCNSLSRHLYLPSAGAAIVYAALLMRLRDRFSSRVAAGIIGLCLAGFVGFNLWQAQVRGRAWQQEGEGMERFLTALMKEVPQFPPHTFLYVNNAPAGRAFVQQALRAFYRNPSITWINDPNSYRRKPGESALLIDTLWQEVGSVRFAFYRFGSP